MKTNRELRKSAAAALKGHWGLSILAIIIFFAIIGVMGSAAGEEMLYNGSQIIPSALWLTSGVSLLVAIFLVGPLEVGLYNSFRKLLAEGNDNIVSNMFRTAFSGYLHKVWGYFVLSVKICLWMLLLIVPGIVMSFAYAMTPFILHENPELSGWEASTRSRRMMKGHKAQLFWMTLGFICLIILSAVTLFIACLWILPYFYTSYAAFYEELKASSEAAA